MQRLYNKHQKKVKYIIVGIWNTVFGLAIFAALNFLLDRYINLTIILVITYFFSITNNYLAYKLLVFKTRGNYVREYFRFYLVYAVTFPLNALLLPVFVSFLKMGRVYSQIIITGIIIVVSYLGHNYFSFIEPSIALKIEEEKG